jgi:penicillin amidase
MTRPTLRAIAWRAALISLALVALAWLWLGASLLASRARLDASLRLGGLEREVVVERDALGVPTINAASRADAARALGFLHAQERFFQMDQSRRVAAGRLAELTGPAALNFDRWTRPLDLQRVADEATARLPERHARLIEAYAQGVNAGLGALAAPPPEYLALRAAPEPWRPRDTYLVALSMHLGLSREGAVDISTRQLRDALPRTLVDFLTPAPHALGRAAGGRRRGLRAPPDSRSRGGRSARGRGRRRAGSRRPRRPRLEQLGGRRRPHRPTAGRSWPTTCTSGSASRTCGTARTSASRPRARPSDSPWA